jgi:hypothetical protein
MPPYAKVGRDAGVKVQFMVPADVKELNLEIVVWGSNGERLPVTVHLVVIEPAALPSGLAR